MVSLLDSWLLLLESAIKDSFHEASVVRSISFSLVLLTKPSTAASSLKAFVFNAKIQQGLSRGKKA
jgi:hypothetical protein